MDAQQHRRFLSYLELRDYFPKMGGELVLDAATFVALDTELAALLKRQAKRETTPEDVRRIAQLRSMLLRD